MINPSLLIRSFFKHSYWLTLLFLSPCFAQTPQIDSIKLELKKSIPDTVRLKLLKKIATAYTPVDLKQRFYYASLSKDLAVKIHDDKSVADAFLSMGVSYTIRGLNDSAIYYYNKAYSQADKSRYDMVMGKCLVNLGLVNDRLDNDLEAIQYYFRGLEVFKRMKYTPGINQCYINIGSLYSDLGQNDVAKSYFEQSLKIARAEKDEKGIAYGLFTVGNCYQALNKDQLALTYLNKSLAIRKKLNDANGIGVVQRAKGLAYYHLKNYSEAIANLDSALATMQQLGDKYQEAAMMLALIDVHLANGNKDKAEYYGLSGLQITRQIASKSGMSLLLEKLVSVYKSKNDISKAFKYQSEYVEIQDSIRVEKQLKDVTLAEIRRTRSENAALTDNNRAITSENTGYLTKLQQYNNLLVIIVATLASVVLVVVILYRRNKEKQLANHQLLLQKEEIGQINRELELLNEEINTQMELTTAQNAELERLNEVKNKFFSIISHDLRGPLNTLQTLFSIYREGDIKEAELRMLLARLEDTILTTGAFLDNLLEWSKSQLEGIVVQAIDFDVRDTITDNLNLFKTKIEFKSLNVTDKVKHAVFAHADPNMIKLVIRNLLSNSIKFCQNGQKIEISADIESDRAIITIKDTGPGISEAEVEKLFSLEHTISTSDQGEKGNRLGLILCRDMITQNGGTLTLETKLNQGTTFRIDLPAGKRLATLF